MLFVVTSALIFAPTTCVCPIQRWVVGCTRCRRRPYLKYFYFPVRISVYNNALPLSRPPHPGDVLNIN